MQHYFVSIGITVATFVHFKNALAKISAKYRLNITRFSQPVKIYMPLSVNLLGHPPCSSVITQLFIYLFIYLLNWSHLSAAAIMKRPFFPSPMHGMERVGNLTSQYQRAIAKVSLVHLRFLSSLFQLHSRNCKQGQEARAPSQLACATAKKTLMASQRMHGLTRMTWARSQWGLRTNT